ncbi:MAG: hypothetical protein ORO03_03525, partial [Alphaproteobacteria bacterium]|nr:hypothetical protein [Alphaproteobacteria bacterium]
SLTLSSDVTATGGDANITVSGAFTNAGRKWTTNGKNVTISFGSVEISGTAGTSSVAFEIGAGNFSQTLTGGYTKKVGVYTVGQEISDTNYDWRTLDKLSNATVFVAANVTTTTTFGVVTGGLLRDQDVTFFGVTAAADLTIDAKSVLFKNTNSFTNLTITTYGTGGAGSVTQEGGSLTATSLTITAAAGSAVTLDQTGNRIAVIAGLSGSNLSVITGGNLQFTGDAVATGTASFSSVDLILDSTKRLKSTSLSLTATGNVTLNGPLETTGGALSLTATGTDKTVTFATGAAITTAGVGAAITIIASNLTLTSAVTTVGGAVTIDLKNGTFKDNNAAGDNRFTWTSTNQNVTINNLGTLISLSTASQKAFNIGTGNFTQEGSSGVTITKDRVLVVKVKSNEISELFGDLYQTITVADLSATTGANFAQTDVTTTGTFTAPTGSLDLSTRDVHFYQVRTNATVSVLKATFYGDSQIGGFRTTPTMITLADGATLEGNYSLSGATITLGNQSLLKGVISNLAGSNLTLKLAGDYTQTAGSSFDIQGGVFKVVGNSYNINLSNQNNRFNETASIEVDSNGGSFQLATGSTITSTSLKTAGGWVALRSGGNIKVSGLETGRVSFRAGGSVSLTGSFAGAEGTGSSIVLNSSSAGVVIGSLAATSSSITLKGSGTAILTGDIVANSSAEIEQKAVVAGPASIVVSSGGVVTTNSTINAIAASIANSLLISVGSGQINLGDSIGTTTRLGWVQLEGYNLNSAGGVSISWFDGSGTPSLSDVKPHWRNGASF